MFLRDAQLEALIEELVRNPPAITIDEELWLQTRIELNAVLALWQKEMNNLMNPATAIGDISRYESWTAGVVEPSIFLQFDYC